MALALLALGAGGSSAASRHVMVAIDDLAPGEPFGAHFTRVAALGITNDGTAVIWGATFAPLEPSDYHSEGIWTWDRTHGLQRLDTGSLGFDLSPPLTSIGGGGRIVIVADTPYQQLLDCHVGESACTAIASMGDSVAGVPEGWTLDAFTSIDLDASDSLVFTASLRKSGDLFPTATGVFTAADEIAPIAISGDAIPGTNGAVLGYTNQHARSSSDATVFISIVPTEPPEIWVPWDSAGLLARWTPAMGLEGLLVGGEPAPGGDPGATFVAPVDFGPPVHFDVNDAGTVEFEAQMIDADAPTPPTPALETSGIWVCPLGSACSLGVREGEGVPGDDHSVIGTALSDHPFQRSLIAPDGTVLFSASFVSTSHPPGPGGSGTFAVAPDLTLRTLSRTGDPDPTGDATFTGTLVYAAGPQHRVVMGGGVELSQGSGQGIYTIEPDGQVVPVLRVFDPIDPATSDPLAAALFFGVSDPGVEYAVLIAQKVLYQDATLIFATLPEAGSIASASVCVLALAVLSRRRS
jgi:hypothetical protein